MGFSVDMDRAYHSCNNNGQFIPNTHPGYKKNLELKENFIYYTNKLLDYFEKNNYNQSVTWFVNEATYKISSFHKDILKRCSESGELGLHTHFNCKIFNADPYTMSKNRNDWEKNGIKDANMNINTFLDYNNFIFKAGNHIRNNELFDALSDNLFSIDTTHSIDDGFWICNKCNGSYVTRKRRRGRCRKTCPDPGPNDGLTLFNDTNILLGSEPYFIKCDNNGIILEIPEIRSQSAIEHVKKCKINNNLCFIKLQIHHWQYDKLIPRFDELIKTLKKEYYVEFIDLKQMQKLFFEKKYKLLEKKVKKEIREKLPNDTYYISLRQCIAREFFELSLWLFNNYDKRSKIIELFAGIGQCSLFLHELEFNNLTICDFDRKRGNFYKEIDNYKNIIPLVSDFYDVNLNKYDICFFGNSINSSLCDKLDIQVEKYQHFIDKDKLLIIHSKYGSGIKEFNYLLDNLKNYSIIKQIGNYFAIKKINNDFKIIPFSKQFKLYKTIGFSNIIDKVICDKEQQLIKLKFKENIQKSAGIFFPLHYSYSNLKEQIYKCKLSFDVKIDNENNESKIKIYTGIKWTTIEKELTNTFQTIEFEDDFNFFKASTYRIGFVNIENNCIYFKNICLYIYI